MIHRELCAGQIAAAVYNAGPYPPKDPVSAAAFMPNHRANSAPAEREWDEPTKKRIADYQQMVLDLAARQKEEARARGESVL